MEPPPAPFHRQVITIREIKYTNRAAGVLGEWKEHEFSEESLSNHSFWQILTMQMEVLQGKEMHNSGLLCHYGL